MKEIRAYIRRDEVNPFVETLRAAGAPGVARIGGGHGNSPRSDPALAVLRERYAKGQIGRDEFERKLRSGSVEKKGRGLAQGGDRF